MDRRTKYAVSPVFHIFTASDATATALSFLFIHRIDRATLCIEIAILSRYYYYYLPPFPAGCSCKGKRSYSCFHFPPFIPVFHRVSATISRFRRWHYLLNLSQKTTTVTLGFSYLTRSQSNSRLLLSEKNSHVS